MAKAFKQREVVWAKLRGYPYWPAQIINLPDEYSDKDHNHSSKAEVLFLGENLLSKVSMKHIQSYKENFDKYSKPDKKRNAKLREKAILDATNLIDQNIEIYEKPKIEEKFCVIYTLNNSEPNTNDIKIDSKSNDSIKDSDSKTKQKKQRKARSSTKPAKPTRKYKKRERKIASEDSFEDEKEDNIIDSTKNSQVLFNDPFTSKFEEFDKLEFVKIPQIDLELENKIKKTAEKLANGKPDEITLKVILRIVKANENSFIKLIS